MTRSGFGIALTAALVVLSGTIAAPFAHAQETSKPVAATPAVPVAAPADARALLKDAGKKAAKEKKAVMVIFHASWCGWCHKLDGFLTNPDIKPIMESNYVVVHLDVMENGDKKSLENPGGGDLMKELGGEKAGLPFYAILNPKGEKLADSNAMPGNNNIGYPAAPEEITAFEGILKKTAPRLDETKRTKLVAWLKTNAPKQQ